MLMAKLIKGYYKDGVWHEYGGKLYDTIGYNTNGSMTQKAISDTLGGVLELISGYSMAIRVHGDASVTNLNPFYFVTDGESFATTITYNQPAIALNVISIIMDGTDITQEAYQDGVISIDRVTGNVVITVETASVTDTTMFTKRETGNAISILNNIALLKGVKGNTVLWNNRWLTSSAGTNSSICTLSYTDDELILTATGNSSSTSAKLNAYIAGIGVTDNLFYVRAEVYIETTTSAEEGHFGIGWVSSNSSTSGGNTARPKNEWFTVESRTKIGTSKILMLAGVNGNKWLADGESKIRVKNLVCVNLTTMFGAGNEPTAAVFGKLFQSRYYAYNGGATRNLTMTNYISSDGGENVLQNVNIDVCNLSVNGGSYLRMAKLTPVTGKYYLTTSKEVGSTWNYTQSSDASAACIARTVKAGEEYHIYSFNGYNSGN